MGKWWLETPWRMIQTNLRQIDMEDMSAEQFVKDLKSFDATVVLLNTAGIIASYKTKLKYHFQSEHLHGDSLQEVAEACHSAGIRVIARTDFSKIRRPVFEQHPEWAYRTAAGGIVDYNGDVHACINGAYQQEYLFEIIKEALEEVRLDGIFCNMGGFQVRDYSYNYYGICHCDSCGKLFRKRFGLELPAEEDLKDPAYRKYRVFQRECVSKHNERLYRHIKAISPDLAVNGYDIQRTESNTEYKRPLPHWQYSASSNTRAIRGAGERELAASNCTVDFIGFWYRHVAVSPAMQELRLWQNLANLGGLDFYLIGRLDNHEDRSGYAGVRKVFRFHRENEKEFAGLTSRAEALLLRAEFFVDVNEERGWIRALTENHILFDEARFAEAEKYSFDKYRAVILPGVLNITPGLAGKLDAFAKKGGVVVCAGEAALRDENFEYHDRPLLECLGVDKVNRVRDDMASAMLRLSAADKEVFAGFTDGDLVAVGSAFVFADIKPAAQRFAALIPPHHIGPPERCYYTQVTDIPGVTKNPFGKGAGVFIPWLPGELFCEGGYDNTMLFMRGVLFGLCGLSSAAPGLPPQAEVAVAEKPGATVVQLVNASGHFGTSFYRPLPIHNAGVSLPLAKAPSGARSLFKKGNASYTYENGMLNLTVGLLEEYEAVVIDTQ
jgi:hypothetical protein